jgi:hypothetical protein
MAPARDRRDPLQRSRSPRVQRYGHHSTRRTSQGSLYPHLIHAFIGYSLCPSVKSLDRPSGRLGIELTPRGRPPRTRQHVFRGSSYGPVSGAVGVADEDRCGPGDATVRVAVGQFGGLSRPSATSDRSIRTRHPPSSTWPVSNFLPGKRLDTGCGSPQPRRALPIQQASDHARGGVRPKRAAG